jgi:hypothetical protein
MVYRCKQEKLISDVQAKKILLSIAVNWVRKEEHFDDVIEKENPFYFADKIRNNIKSKEDFEHFINKVCLPIDDITSLTSLPKGYFDDFITQDSTIHHQTRIIKQLSLFE